MPKRTGESILSVEKGRSAGKSIKRPSLELETSIFGSVAWPLSFEAIFQTISSIMIVLLQSGSISPAKQFSCRAQKSDHA
jgi:hypothetical protein